MNITELKNDKIDFQVKVTIPVSEVNSSIEKELVKVAKTAKIDGFRAGKVPASFLKKRYYTSIRSDVVRELINNAINKTISDNKLSTAFDPQLEDLINEEGEELEFTLKFERIPEIAMPDFKKISIEKPVFEVSDNDVNEQIDRLISFSKEYTKEVKTKAKSGDQVTIDAVGYVGDKAFEGGTLVGHKLVLGSNAFIPGFEDQLIGAKTGDDVSVKVDFPKEYHAHDLAGKASEFKVQVKAVHQAVSMEINDDFAKKFNCDSVDALKEQIIKNIQNTYEDPIRTLMKMKLFDQLEDILTFEVPSSILQREKDILVNQALQEEGGEDPEIASKSDEEKDKYYEKLSLRRVRLGLMLAEYVKLKNLQIEEQDIRKAIISQAKNYPGQEQQVIEFYQKDRRALESLKGPVLEEKAVQNIFDHEINLKTKSYNRDKLEKLLEKENI